MGSTHDRNPDRDPLPAMCGSKAETGETMTNLDRMMEFLLAGVFLWIGFKQILSYPRRPKVIGASNKRLPLGLPYGAVVAIGIFEIVAAMALLAPFGSGQPASLPLYAATGLALLTLTAAFLNARRRRPASHSMVLFLMALFVIVGHTL